MFKLLFISFLLLLDDCFCENSGSLDINVYDYNRDEEGGLYSIENYVVCTGENNSETQININNCIEMLKSDKNGATALPLDTNENFNHIFILAKTANDKATNKRARYVGVFPTSYPGNRKILLFKNAKVSIDLTCYDGFYGALCTKQCVETSEYACHPKTGEKIFCEFGNKLLCKENRKISRIKRHTPPQFLFEEINTGCGQSICFLDELGNALTPIEEVTDPELSGPVNFCDLAPCSRDGTSECVNAKTEVDFLCLCKKGYSGELCEKLLNPCDPSPCQNNGTCIEEDFDFTCKCETDFIGIYCEMETNACNIIEQPCVEHGVCVPTSDKNNFTCLCDAGYTGDRCEDWVDFCANNPCLNNGECVAHVGYFTCDCPGNFQGEICELFDPCFSKPCLHGGECSPDGEDFTCSCEMGFSGKLCQDEMQDPCLGDPCKNGTCHPRKIFHEGNETFTQYFECVCDVGYNGHLCNVRRSPCERFPPACPTNATCKEEGEDYRCICPLGYGGEYCEEKCSACGFEENVSCKENSCKNDARCLVHADGSQNCICQVGFEGEHCEKQINYCEENACVHGSCILLVGKYECECNEGYKGDYCDIDVDECTELSQVCKYESTCINTEGDFTCECKYGYTGRHCEHKINACFSDPCKNGAECWPNEDSFLCRCKTGYVGVLCELSVDPCNDTPTHCQNNGTCHLVDLEKQLTRCECQRGFTGEVCENIEDFCVLKKRNTDGSETLVPNTDCGKQGVCQSNYNGFTCACLNGYTGRYCTIEPVVECIGDKTCFCKSKTSSGLFAKAGQKCRSTVLPDYGVGKCESKTVCVAPPCDNFTHDLTCTWDRKCEETKNTTQSNKCTKLEVIVQRNELENGTTDAEFCNELKSLKSYLDVQGSMILDCVVNDNSDTDTIIFNVYLANVSQSCDLEKTSKNMFEEIRKNILLEYPDPKTHEKYPILQGITNLKYNFNDKQYEAFRESKLPTKSYTYIAIIIVLIFVVLVGLAGFLYYKHKHNLYDPKPAALNVQPMGSPTLSAHGILIEPTSASWTKSPKNGDYIFSYDNPSNTDTYFGNESPEQQTKSLPTTNNNLPIKERLV